MKRILRILLVVAAASVPGVARADPVPPAPAPPAPKAPIAPKVPKECGAYVHLADAKVSTLQATGKVKSITARQEPRRFEIVVADAKGDQSFALSIVPEPLPFKVGDALDVSVRRGGGWHRVYDALIKDGSGKILIVASGSGADDWADGWKVTTGKVVQSEQNPNTKQQSLRRTHALDFARGKANATVAPDRCALLQDGADRYLVSGSGHSWLGERPPEGVDYQTFSMLRR
ncbi:MAG TPA: hypothetical protein VNO30_10240 [Kofleriaceae bacterium]|nr:hypothetical protein [Kofleriaceae bacterium]